MPHFIFVTENSTNAKPAYRGHLLSNEDGIIRKHILNLMCKLETAWEENDTQFIDFNNIIRNLMEMKRDEIIKFDNSNIQVTEKGKPFVRNVCMAFDLLLQQKQPETHLFSMTV